MADTYSTNLKARLIEDNAYGTTWGSRMNSDALALLDDAISGKESINLGTSTTYSLAALANGSDVESRSYVLKFTGTPASGVTLTIPATVTNKTYIVDNQCGQTITAGYSTGTTVAISNSAKLLIYADGSNVVLVNGYQRTAAETAASVTVVNPFYPPLYVDRYGNNTTPGTTDMSAAFSAACKVAKTSGGTVRYGATAPYMVTSPIDCTQATGSTQFGFTITQEANFQAATLNSPTYPSIIAKHTGHVFDCAGATGINFENVTVGTDTTTFPETCFFLARNSAGSSQIHRFTKVMVHGKFSDSIVYNYGSEDEQYVGCQFFNVSTGAGTKVIRWTCNNISSLSSTFITIATGQQSCIDHQIIGGQFWNASGDAAADVFYLEGNCDSIKIHAPWVKCGVQGGAGGRAIVYVDGTNTMASYVSIYNLTTEHSGGGANQNKYGILFSNHARTPTGWFIDGGVWDNQTFAIACAGSSPTIDSFTIRAFSESVTHGISIPGTLQGSYVSAPTVLVIGTSSRNCLIGYKANMTLSSRSNDVIIDHFTGSIDAKGTLTLGGNIATASSLGLFGASPPAQITGFGTPTGNTVVANFPGATATLLQTSQTVAEILVALKGMGLIAT